MADAEDLVERDSKDFSTELKPLEDGLSIETNSTIIFKRKPRRHIRQKIKCDDDSDKSDNEAEVSEKLGALKEIQSLRKRPNGVSIVSLTLGKKMSTEDEVNNDPFKVEAGGMINMQALKSGKIKRVDDAYDTGIGTQFSVETNKRDEDEEMMKYIEEKLAKRKGNSDNANADSKGEESASLSKKYCTPEEAALQAVPIHLRESSTHRSEEMLSNQMLSGIPEVDLGIEAKIKNIEATEEAKLKLLKDRLNKKQGPSHFVPSNMAVNFVQHNRFNIDKDSAAKKAKLDPKPQKEESKPKRKDDKATDDYHFEKFKKQFRRY